MTNIDGRAGFLFGLLGLANGIESLFDEIKKDTNQFRGCF